MNRSKTGMLVLAGLVVLLIGLLPAGAVDRSWTAGGANNNWTTTNNWTGNTVPTAADRAILARDWQTDTVTLDTPSTIGDLFLQGYYNLTVNTANTLTITNSMYSRVWYRKQIQLNCPVDVRGLVTVRHDHYWVTYKDEQGLLRFLAAGNVIRGGIDLDSNYASFEGNNNVFSNTLRAAGRLFEQRRDANWYRSGVVDITGAGNTFGTGQFVLDPCGKLIVSQAANFSGLTNINFNGGALELGTLNPAYSNTFPVLPGGFNVRKGKLWVWDDRALDGLAAKNGIQLGSPNYYGELIGSAPNTVLTGMIYRAITLNGNGGRLCAYNNGVWNQSVAGVISGTGELFVNGYHVTYLANGPYTVLTPNLYSGGTRVGGGNLYVESLRTIGSGNLRIDGSASAYFYATNGWAPGTKVYVGGLGVPGTRVFCPARLGVGGNLPEIDTNSVGAIAFNAYTAVPRLTNYMGRVHLMAWSWGGSAYAPGPIPPGSDGIYRVGSSPGDGFLGLGGGFYGTNALEVGVPYNVLMNGGCELTGYYQGGIEWSCVNTFSGPITIHQGGQFTGWSQPTDGTSSFGASNGEVRLNGGLLTAAANVAAERIQRKGPVYVQGGAHLNGWDRGFTTFGCATFGCDSIQRKNMGCVKIGVNGTTTRVRVFNSPPSMINNIVAPWMVGTDAFLTYDAAAGFTNAPWTQVVGAGLFPSLVAGTDIVNVNGAATLQNDPSLYALRVGNVTLSASGANDTMTIGSGGLMLTGTACRVYPNLVFGSVGTPVEGIIHVQTENNINQLNYPILYGQITAAGITKFGEGNVAVCGNNIGTLNGPIIVNEGILMVTNANSFGSTTNWIILNGGTVGSMYWTYAGAAIGVTNEIKIGPLGGGIGSGYDTAAFVVYGPISDLIPGDGGPVRHRTYGNAVGFYGTNTYSGGTICSGYGRFDGFCSLGTGPVRVDSSFVLFTYPNLTEIQGRVSLNGYESQFALMMCPVRIGSLDGNGNVRFGDPYTDANAGGGNPDKIISLLVGTDNTDADFYGTMWEEPYRVGRVLKVGTGNQTLWGDCTYHKDTTVSNGTLTVNGWMPFTPNVWVWPGARLTGKGAFSAPLAGVYLIGNSTLDGTLRFDNSPFVDVSGGGKIGGNVVFSGADTLVWFEDAASSLQFNLSSPSSFGLTMDGLLDLADYGDSPSSLNVTLGFAPTPGQVFTVVNNTGSQAIYGQFANAPNNGVLGVMYGGKMYYFRVNYAGGDGNDLTLTALPFGSLIMLR